MKPITLTMEGGPTGSTPKEVLINPAAIAVVESVTGEEGCFVTMAVAEGEGTMHFGVLEDLQTIRGRWMVAVSHGH